DSMQDLAPRPPALSFASDGSQLYGGLIPAATGSVGTAGPKFKGSTTILASSSGALPLSNEHERCAKAAANRDAGEVEFLTSCLRLNDRKLKIAAIDALGNIGPWAKAVVPELLFVS